MAEKQNIPEIRFEGFTDPWEQRKLGDITSSYSGGTPQANNPDYYNGSIPFIRSAEINADKTELYLTEKGLAESSAALVDAGCILYALYGATSGEAGISRINGAINQAILAIYPYAGFDSGFLASWLRREKDAIVATYLQGGQGNLSGAIVKDFKVPVPGLPEQKAIGDCLSSLDNLITLHQRKYDKLCTVKKSMLDKMFPKPGETEPEIRFEGFTDPWEQRKLGELYSLVSEKNDLTFGRESIISVANMYFNANVNVTDEQYLRTFNVMRLGDIAFEGHSNKEFSHGRFVENYIGDGIVSHIFTVLRPRVPFDVNYWRYAINNEKLMRLSLTRSTKASTMMHDLVPSDFLREAIPTPTLAEQKEIGAFLVGLDHLITLHQRKLELLRNIKKSLLDRMFV